MDTCPTALAFRNDVTRRSRCPVVVGSIGVGHVRTEKVMLFGENANLAAEGEGSGGNAPPQVGSATFSLRPLAQSFNGIEQTAWGASAGANAPAVLINPFVGKSLRLFRTTCAYWRNSIETFFEAVILTIGALLPIMNPFSTAPLFASLTASFDGKKRTHQAFMGCIYAFGILVVFLLLGAAIIDFFGISIPGIRVAGGLIIATIGFRMLFPDAQTTTRAASQAQHQDLDFSFTPIAMPSLAGPGSISVVLGAAAQIKSDHAEQWVLIYAAVVVGMALTLVIAFLVLRAASSMTKFLGRGGIDAMTRIFGFLLICIGMQFLLTGIDDFFAITSR